MNKIIYIGLLSLAACTQLMHGQEQPIITKDIRNKIYLTTCGGAVEDWASCYDKARRTCGNDYSVITKGDDSRGTYRSITFQCKN